MDYNFITGRVYSSLIPEIYTGSGNRIKYTFFFEECAVGYQNGSLYTSPGLNSK